MMPRRARKNRDLEANLYQNGEYYQYKHPITGNRISLGKDRKQANAAARIANIRLQKEPDRVAKILGTNDGLSALIDRFESEYLPEKEYAKSSLREIKIKLNLYKNEFAGTSIHAIDVKTLADWLYQFTRASYIKHRLLWIDLFKYAMSQGLVTFNVAEATLYKRPAKRKRDRLTEGDYKSIYAIAPEWFQIAMQAALYTLQRRGDLVRIKFTDYKDGTLKVVQSKTGTALKIKANIELHKLIRRSIRTGVIAKHLVHRNPTRKRREYLNQKEHWAQVTPEMLSREFARLRELAGVKPAAGKAPPTFHEIRSLGGRLLEERGYSTEFIQALMGHADKSMTEHYLEDGSINWQMAEVGLKL